MVAIAFPLFFVLVHITALVASSPTRSLPRASESEQLDDLCVAAFNAYDLKSYYYSETVFSKSKTVGSSRVGPRRLACTAWYRCEAEKYYNPKLTGEILLQIFALQNLGDPHKDWEWRLNERGLCEIGVIRQSGYGIKVPADIAEPKDQAGPTWFPVPTDPPTSTVPDAVSTPTITTSSSTLPPVPIPSVYEDVDVANSLVEEALKDTDNADKKSDAIDAISKAQTTIERANKGFGRGLLSALNTLSNLLEKIGYTLRYSKGKLTEEEVKRIKWVKEKVAEQKERVERQEAKEASTRTATASATSTSSSSAQCETPMGTPGPLTFSVVDGSGKWGYHDEVAESADEMRSFDTNSSFVFKRALERRRVTFCTQWSSAWYAPGYEPCHDAQTLRNNPNLRNPYGPWYTLQTAGSCLATLEWQYSVTDNAVGGASYATEHVYELQFLDWFLWNVGWTNPASRTRYPDLPADIAAGFNSDQLGRKRASRFCQGQIIPHLLQPAAGWTPHRFFETPAEHRNDPVIKRLVEQMSSDAFDTANPGHRELTYLDNRLNGIKASFFGFAQPDFPNTLEGKLDKIIRMATLFEYLRDDNVVRAWAQVSRRVRFFYNALDDAGRTAGTNWAMASAIAWRQAYDDWEPRALRHLASQWKANFEIEMGNIARMIAAEKAGSAYWQGVEKKFQVWAAGPLNPDNINVERLALSQSLFPGP